VRLVFFFNLNLIQSENYKGLKIAATNLPINIEPSISKIVARIHACFRVKTFEPTLVPNEFATSLAPIPNAKTNAITNPQITSQNWPSQQFPMISIFLKLSERKMKKKS
jgi:hypothetical protein